MKQKKTHQLALYQLKLSLWCDFCSLSTASMLCRVSEDGTATLNSTQSIIHLTLGNFSLTECGSFCLTASEDGQEPNFTYMKLIQVINVSVTVPSETLNK